MGLLDRLRGHTSERESKLPPPPGETSDVDAQHRPISKLISYRLARTVAQIDSTVQITVADDGTKQFSRTNTVTVTGAADPACEYELELGKGDIQFDLHFTADGRLSSAQRTATGVGSTVISAGLTLATATASLAEPTLKLAALAAVEPADAHAHEGDDRNTPAGRYAYENGAADAQRKTLGAQAVALDQALVAFAGQLPEADMSLSAQQQTRLQTLTATQDAVQKALSNANAAYQSWKASHYPTISRQLTTLLDLTTLPSIEGEIPSTRPFDSDQLKGQSHTASSLGIVLAVFGDTARPPGQSEPEPAGTTDPQSTSVKTASAIVYRRPRPVVVAVYAYLAGQNEAELHLATKELSLVQTIPAWVIDERSEKASLPLDHPIFGSSEVTIGFDDNGLLSEVGSSRTSALAEIAKVISGAGGTITSTLDDISKVQQALTPTDPAVAALTKQVTQVELQARLARAQATIAHPTGS